jgi:DNA-binding XRE family transcriptional regulator
MNKFAEWMKKNDKKQKGVAEKLGIGTTTLHEILKNKHLPSLILAYKIEKYTRCAVTMYDWIDYLQEEKKASSKPNPQLKEKKIKK